MCMILMWVVSPDKQVLIILWMTKSITDDFPGWGDLFRGYPGDGTASVIDPLYSTLLFVLVIPLPSPNDTEISQ